MSDASGAPESASAPRHNPPCSANRSLVVAVAGLLTAVFAAAFVVAPVVVHQPVVKWSAAADGRSAGLPLLTGHPDVLTLTVPCAGGDGVVLTTVPPDGGDTARGLVLTRSAAVLSAAEGGQEVLSVALPQGCTAATATFSATDAEVAVDGIPATQVDGDRRPVVVGLFAPTAAGDVSAVVLADNRFDSSPSLLKIALAVAALASAAVTLAALRRGRHPARASRRLPRPGWRDGLVVLVLGGWALAGPTTVDDGYISTMIRNRGAAGFVGNYYRWFNSPEAPFGWFYEIYALWARLGTGMAWLRLPSVALGLATWLVVDRLLRRRCLGAAGMRPLVGTALLVTFLLWWLPYDSGMRPEPWIALGTALVLVLVERATATGRDALLALAAFVAGASLAIGPTGIIAFAPLVVHLGRIVRRLAAQPVRVRVATLLGVAGLAAVPLLLMFADQSLGAVLEATRVRQEIGPNLAWQTEYVRYATLLQQDATEGSLSRRVPVLLAVVASGYLTLRLLTRDRMPLGLPTGPLARLTGTVVLGALALTVTPTKWTHHFGAFAGLGALLLAAVVAAEVAAPQRSRAWRAGTTVVFGLALGLALYGYNGWWYLSGLGVAFAERTPAVGGVQLSTAAVALGAAVAVGQIVLRRGRQPGAAWPTGVVLVLVAVLLLETGTLAFATRARAGTYAVTTAATASWRDRCALEDLLQVETDRANGALPEAGQSPSASPALTALPAVPGVPREVVSTRREAEPVIPVGDPYLRPGTATRTVSSPWYRIKAEALSGTLPVVVAAAGTSSGAVSAVAEFRSSVDPAVPVSRTDLATGGTQLVDTRITVPQSHPGADEVRIVLDDGSARPGDWVSAAAPRIPVTTSLSTLNPEGTPTAVDWRSAFYLSCTTPTAVAGGETALPRYLVTSEAGLDGTASLGLSRRSAGAYTPLLPLVDLVPMPVYLTGDVLRDVATVYRLEPRVDTVLAPSARQDVPTGGLAHEPPVVLP